MTTGFNVKFEILCLRIYAFCEDRAWDTDVYEITDHINETYHEDIKWQAVANAVGVKKWTKRINRPTKEYETFMEYEE